MRRAMEVKMAVERARWAAAGDGEPRSGGALGSRAAAGCGQWRRCGGRQCLADGEAGWWGGAEWRRWTREKRDGRAAAVGCCVMGVAAQVGGGQQRGSRGGRKKKEERRRRKKEKKKERKEGKEKKKIFYGNQFFFKFFF